MPRIPSPEVGSLSEKARRIYERMPMNVILMMLGASLDVAEGFQVFSSSLYSGSKLSPRLRELAALRIGYLSNAPYELFQHESLARMAGVTEKEMEAIRDRGADAEELGPDDRAVLAFTDEVALNVRPGDDTLAAVREFLDDRDLMDLTLAIGNYMMVIRFLETTGVEIDEAPLDREFVVQPEESA